MGGRTPYGLGLTARRSSGIRAGRSALTRRVLRHGDFASRNDLIEKLEAYVIGHNETIKPYRWTHEGTPLKAA